MCNASHVTATEVRLLMWVARGATDKQISSELALSTNTVSTYLLNLRMKLRAGNRAELVARAYTLRLLCPDTWPPAVTDSFCLPF